MSPCTATSVAPSIRNATVRIRALQMRLPFEPSLDDREAKFYAMPQPALPPKDLDQEPPKFYEQARRGPEQEA